jgi:hypothetical protein
MLVALVISPKAEAQGMRLLTGVDRSTFIETTGIDDFVAPISETFYNSHSPKSCNSSQG